MLRDVWPGFISKDQFPSEERKTIFNWNVGLFVATQITDLGSTALFVLNKLDTEGNDLLGAVHPLLSPKFVVENYGLEGLALQKAILGALVVLNLLSMRSNGYQERAIFIFRATNLVIASVSLLNLIIPRLPK